MNETSDLPPHYCSLKHFARHFENDLPILLYHKIAPPPADAVLRGLYVSPRLFARQMSELQRAGFAGISLAAVAKPTAANGRRFVITFDDGYANVLANALPILHQHDLRAIQFIVARRLAQHNDWDRAPGGKTEPLMDETQVREWLAAGQEIGSPTLTHPLLTQLPLPDARREIVESKKFLEDKFGVRIGHFCYPYGDCNPAVHDLVAEAGYTTACTTQRGVNRADTDPFALRRILWRDTVVRACWRAGTGCWEKVELDGGKDFLINQLRKERDGFVQQLVEGSRRIGQLESELRQLSGPRNDAGGQIETNP